MFIREEAWSMKNIADIQHTEEPFEFDGRPYLFDPEYTDEELASRVGKNETDRQRGNRQMNLLLQAQAKASLQ